MAVFKCKMCGGDLDVVDNMSVAKCPYCGANQTLPRLDNERKLNLFDRANHFRRNNDYDKAMSIYENILNEDDSDAEAYWSLVLCKYGIEYIEDPSTHRRVPTVNRAQYTSIFADEDYKSAIRFADAYQKSIYESEAKEIDDIQRGILEISQQEEPFDVFICYKETDNQGRRTPDSVLATELYNELIKEGFKVFFSRITLEDKLGTAYEPYIFAALNSSKVMVVLGTKPEYFNAVWVKNEWSRFLALIKNGEKKTLIPSYRDMDPYDLPEEFSHLQAQDMSKLGFMQDLVRGINKIIVGDKASTRKDFNDKSSDQESVLLERGFMALEDQEFKQANNFFEGALNLNPHNARAYFGKFMVEMRISKQEQILTSTRPLNQYKNFSKALQFADQKLRLELVKYEKNVNDNLTDMKFKEYSSELSTLTKKLESDNMENSKENQVINLKEYIDGIKIVSNKFKTIIDYTGAQEQINICKELVSDAEKSILALNQEIKIDNENAIKKNRKNSIISGVSKFISILGCIGLLIVSLLPALVNKYSTMFEGFKTYETWDKYILALVCLIVFGVLGFSLSMFYNSKRWKNYQWWDCVVSLIIYVSVVILLSVVAPYLIVFLKWVLIIGLIIGVIIAVLAGIGG